MKAFLVKGWNNHEETINEGMDLRDYFAGLWFDKKSQQFTESFNQPIIKYMEN